MDYPDPTYARWIGTAKIITIDVSFRQPFKSNAWRSLSSKRVQRIKAMRTVEDRLSRILTAADVRLRTAKTTDSRRKRVSGIARADREITEALAHDDPSFIYAIAARAKHATPIVITVQTANGLALQMLKS